MKEQFFDKHFIFSTKVNYAVFFSSKYNIEYKIRFIILRLNNSSISGKSNSVFIRCMSNKQY